MGLPAPGKIQRSDTAKGADQRNLILGETIDISEREKKYGKRKSVTHYSCREEAGAAAAGGAGLGDELEESEAAAEFADAAAAGAWFGAEAAAGGTAEDLLSLAAVAAAEAEFASGRRALH